MNTLIGTTVEVIDLTEYVNDDEVSCSPRKQGACKLSEYIDRKNQVAIFTHLMIPYPADTKFTVELASKF